MIAIVVRVRVGDIFQSDAQTLVNTVNTVGVMGKGLALEFRQRFPDMYVDYVERCKRGQVRVGQPYIYTGSTPWIINFPTKEHWRSVSRLSDIVQGLRSLEAHYQEWGVTSLAVPPLGCGLGQLEWRIVGPILYQALARLRIPVELFAPRGTPEEQMQTTFLGGDDVPLTEGEFTYRERVKPGWIALAAVVNEVEANPYRWPIGRTMFEKLAYFATVVGIETGLVFRRGSYGPFSPGVKRLLTTLVAHGVLVEEREGKRFTIKPGATFDQAAQEYRRDLAPWQALIRKVADLMVRLTPETAEVAASLVYVAHELEGSASRADEEDVVRHTLEWKRPRLRELEEEDVGEMTRALEAMGWLNLTRSPALSVPDLV